MPVIAGERCLIRAKGGCKVNTQDISLSRCFSEGWEGFKNHIGLAIGASVLYGFIHAVLCYIPGLNILYLIIAAFPFMGGFTILVLGIVKNLDPQIGTLFSGFCSGNQWTRWMGLGWLATLYYFVAEIICAIPAGILILAAYLIVGEDSPVLIAVVVVAALGFYVAFMAIAMRWALVFYLGAEGAIATEAIRTSTQWTEGIRWRIFWIAFVLGLLSAAGVIACGIGLLFTVPLSQCCMAALYLDVKQMRTQQAAPQQPSL